MPYILPKTREELDRFISLLSTAVNSASYHPDVGQRQAQYVGAMNYAITKLVAESSQVFTSPNYSTINALIGVLECAKLELYRIVAAPYEDQKRSENGPVA